MSTVRFDPIMDAASEIIEGDVPQTSGGSLVISVQSPPPSEPTPAQSMRLAELSGTLDFWDNPKEDIYTLDDGEPV